MCSLIKTSKNDFSKFVKKFLEYVGYYKNIFDWILQTQSFFPTKFDLLSKKKKKKKTMKTMKTKRLPDSNRLTD